MDRGGLRQIGLRRSYLHGAGGSHDFDRGLTMLKVKSAYEFASPPAHDFQRLTGRRQTSCAAFQGSEQRLALCVVVADFAELNSETDSKIDSHFFSSTCTSSSDFQSAIDHINGVLVVDYFSSFSPPLAVFRRVHCAWQFSKYSRYRSVVSESLVWGDQFFSNIDVNSALTDCYSWDIPVSQSMRTVGSTLPDLRSRSRMNSLTSAPMSLLLGKFMPYSTFSFGFLERVTASHSLLQNRQLIVDWYSRVLSPAPAELCVTRKLGFNVLFQSFSKNFSSDANCEYRQYR